MPGGWELLVILLVLVLLFGASKLPQLARSLGQSARVFKAEARGMQEDDEAATRARAERVDSPELTRGERAASTTPPARDRQRDESGN
ncbi:Sec-independent protein translocase subunit TatA [Saccharopolyspora rosea]|uniref:Sec-independent protein translocase protein TatA n=1 Tax=Saccharopolyspora rosea TaxID=524884 RepID=A0ABW3FXL8_9PSEU